jgi:hypothetical protein
MTLMEMIFPNTNIIQSTICTFYNLVIKCLKLHAEILNRLIGTVCYKNIIFSLNLFVYIISKKTETLGEITKVTI